MKNFIISALSGIRNQISSKRVALFIFIFAFLGESAIFYLWKIEPNPTLRDQIFYTMSGLIVAVFGESAIPILSRKKDNTPNE